MPARVYGDGVWGLNPTQGIYASSVDYDFSCSTEYFANEEGSDVAGVYYNHTGSFSISGMMSRVDDFDGDLGDELILENAPTAFAGAVSTDFAPSNQTQKAIVTGRKHGRQNKGWGSLDVSGDLKPLLGAFVPPASSGGTSSSN